MTVEDLQYLPERHLRKPDASARRLSREQLDTSVPLDHEKQTRLPKIVHETLGVGYGFDRLYTVDLTNGKYQMMPTRHDITKATAHNHATLTTGSDALNRRRALYRGMKANSHIVSDDAAGGIQNLHDTATNTDMKETSLYLSSEKGINVVTYGSDKVCEPSKTWSTATQNEMALAYADKGWYSTRTTTGNVGFFQDTDTGGTSPTTVSLDFNTAEKLLKADGDMYASNHLFDMAYRYLTPSAWEFMESNAETLADLPKVIKDIGQVMDSIYNRGRENLGSRIQNPLTLRLAMALTELGHTLRRARFSNNVTGRVKCKNDSSPYGELNSQKWASWKYKPVGETVSQDITKGVVNEFFWVIDGRYLIAPWWLVTALDQFNFIDDERELEQRDIERKDIVEALNRLFEAADYEKGLTHGSNSTLPMLLFEKYKEGKLKDFTEFTSSEAALAASLLGYETPRDAFYNKKSDNVATVPYFHTLPDAHGALLGSKLAEFQDRIKEESEHSITVASTENFKLGMQVTASFDYQAMLGRTRFGDAHVDLRVYPGGWHRVVKNTFSYRKGPMDSGLTEVSSANVIWFPLMSWSQLAEQTSTEGFLPLGLNGAAYREGYDTLVEWQANYADATSGDFEHGLLWPDVDDNNYWQPGVDNYSARMLGGTNEVFRQWVDRADTIRTENVVAPIFGQINLVAEMSFDTPLAMVQRNFPYLRKLYTVPTTLPHQVTDADVSFDFMSAGDDIHGMSQWRNHSVWKLEDRHLFNDVAHARDGKLDLIAGVVMMNTPPDNWVEIFQLRDWLMFHTSLRSEPIMDAYTASEGAMSRSNGYGSARLVTYQKQVQFDGSVRDVLCTPILGSFTGSVDHATNLAAISMFPETATAYNDYTMFSLDISKIRSETSGVPDAVWMRQSMPASSTLSEDDFVPGRAWSKLWLQDIEVGGRVVSFNEMFYETSTTLRSTNVPTSDMADVAYLLPATSSTANTADSDQHADLAGSKVLTTDGLVAWTHNMGKFIELKREELEYQHAAPSFFVFDKDILDMSESYMRSIRAPFGESTLGPLTFVGGMTAEGTTALSETITGNDRLKLISLSAGTGSSALEGDEPDIEDLAEGDTNPEVAIAEKQEVA